VEKKVDARSLSPEAKEALRFTAVRMYFEQGHSQRAAAKAVGVTRQEVVKWCAKYEKGGWDALKAQPTGRRPGEQMALQPWQCGLIVRLITDKMPDQLKLPFMLWSRAAVRDLIAERFGITFALSSMSNYLKRWGFTPQKPLAKAFEQNPRAVEHWTKTEYPQIQQRAKSEGATIFWGDETGITNEVHHARSYAPEGQTPVVQKTAKKLKLNMISAVTNKGELRFMTYSSSMTQLKFILFLARLIQSVEGKVFFITDNLRVHHGKRVQAWAEEHKDRIELFYIPAYSPELNPDEYLNRDLKTNVHGKGSPRTQADLKANIIGFMRMLQKTPARISKYFHSPKLAYCAASS
jgi:transposase